MEPHFLNWFYNKILAYFEEDYVYFKQSLKDKKKIMKDLFHINEIDDNEIAVAIGDACFSDVKM